MSLEFSGEIWYWRGPAPHHFVTVPADECELLREASRLTTYGWGMIPVVVAVRGVRWETSLFPKDGGYIVPIKAAVRRKLAVGEGDMVTVGLDVAPRGGRLLLDSDHVTTDGASGEDD